MKCFTVIGIAGLLAMALPAVANDNQGYAFGLSNSVANPQRETVTDWLLQQQRETPVAESSELPAQLYVDSQRRLSNTFKNNIPETLRDRASSQQRR